METKAKAAAAEQVRERGAALGALLAGPLEFTLADTARAEPSEAGTGDGAVYTASANFVYAAGAGAAGRAVADLHAAWLARGWPGTLRRYPDGAADATARDPEGFRYTAVVQRDGAGVALWVESPRYRDPDPSTPFPPLRP
ncbi:hypothetical protein [Nocardiopsis trehalosi]|jgi:hypothetical protein|uniref:hypothetical protein n=1 Tax=Nocardiopsis trehalosi TaxID=109329 RepID=UPI00082C4B3D|nr:hypothetical protein [Nocardiopsis trehalosi]